MRPHPFRQMRQTLHIAQAQVALLLAVDGLSWLDQDYGMMFVMNQMIKQFDNPTYSQYCGALGAYLRMLKRLIDALPEGELKTVSAAEWTKLTTGYEDLIGMQP